MIIQTIGLDPSGAVWTDEASNVSRPDPSGADQVDAKHPTRNRKVVDFFGIDGTNVVRLDGPPGTRKEFAHLPDLASPRHRGETAMTDPITHNPDRSRLARPGVVGIGTASFLATPATSCFPTCDRRRVP
jgi:hypothetical protein